MNESVYSTHFFDQQSQASLTSAKIMLPLLFSRWMPKSVDDVGCGIGHWLSVAKEYGIIVNGFDGDYVNANQLLIDPSSFHAVNLESDADLALSSEFVMCLEVAEHISPTRSEWLVSQLTKCADVVLFSAAIPYQGGVHHVNERWQSYWAGLFQSCGFLIVDILRMPLWDHKSINIEYRQNCMVFVRVSSIAYSVICPSGYGDTVKMLDVCHPELYISKIDYVRFKNIGIKRMSRILWSWFLYKATRARTDTGLLD